MGEFGNMLVRELNCEMFNGLQVEYFGKYSSCSCRYNYHGNPKADSIPCGDRILDSYEPASDTDRCMKYTQGLGRITAPQLFIKYIFDNELVPKRFRAHFKPYTGPYRDGRTDYRIAVGLPFVKWLLGQYGVKVKAKPKVLRKDCSEYMEERAYGTWPNVSCRDTSYIHSAIYYIGDVVASNEAFRWFRHEKDEVLPNVNSYPGCTHVELSASDEEYIKFNGKDAISAEKAVDAFISEVLKRLPTVSPQDSVSCNPAPGKGAGRRQPSKPPSILPAT